VRTHQFPPLAPYGDEEDAVEMRTGNDSRWICWQLGDDHFLRVNLYNSGEYSYLISSRTETEEDFCDHVAAEDCAIAPENLKRLLTMKLLRIAKAVQNAPHT